MHSTGTVIGKGSFNDFLFIADKVTIGDNFDGQYPIFGQNVSLYSGSSILGACTISDHCEIGANCTLFKYNLPAHTKCFKNIQNGTTEVSSRSSITSKHFYL